MSDKIEFESGLIVKSTHEISTVRGVNTLTNDRQEYDLSDMLDWVILGSSAGTLLWFLFNSVGGVL